MSHQSIPKIRTKLYIDFLRSLSLEDASLQDTIHDIVLASLLTDDLDDKTTVIPNALFDGRVDSLEQRHGTFKERELVIYGTSARQHLNPSRRQRLLEEVQSTLSSVMNIFYGDVASLDCLTDSKSADFLPQAIQTFKHEIECLRNGARMIVHHLPDMTDGLQEKHNDLNQELKQAVITTFPADNDVRSTDTDLLAATIESSLIKLSLAHARSARALYHHRPSQESKNVAQALSVAYSELIKGEVSMKTESNILDRQLEEYETMLQLVDGGSGGYRQIINDWTKVKQETEECLRDLRRLGWTGD